MISRERVHDLLDHAMRFSRADDVEAQLSGVTQHLTRFANNGIHQNVSQRTVTVSVRVAFGRRCGRASTNRLNTEGLREAVAAAEAIARNSPELPELEPSAGVQTYEERLHHDSATARCGPDGRAKLAGIAIEAARAHALTCAGFVTTGEGVEAIATRRGAFAYYRLTRCGFSTTMMGEDASGWAEGSESMLACLDVRRMVHAAVEKARAGAKPRALRPGRYAVILEPSAVYDLLLFLQEGFGGRQVLEQQSFLTDRLGQRIFGENIEIHDDVAHPLHDGPYFDGEALPRKSVHLVERGVARALVHDRATARAFHTESTGHAQPPPNPLGPVPINLVVVGGHTTLEDMIRSTERGILVTRFWYTRLVEPMKVVLTGMTRDGTFLIEDGRIKHGVRNLRYQQSVVEMLNRVTAMGPSVRASWNENPTIVLPPMKVEGFRFVGKATTG